MQAIAKVAEGVCFVAVEVDWYCMLFLVRIKQPAEMQVGV